MTKAQNRFLIHSADETMLQMLGIWFFEVKSCFVTFLRFGGEAANWGEKMKVLGDFLATMLFWLEKMEPNIS